MNDLILKNNVLTLDKLNKYQETFLDYLDVDDLTLKTYRVGITSFLNYLVDNNIYYPTRENVIAYRDMLRITYSSNTVNTYMVGIKALFKFLSIKGLYKNITEDIKGAKYDTTPKKEVLKQEQITEIYNSLTDKREKALFGLMVTTGLRVCEVASANIEDIKEYNGETVLFVLGKKRDSKNEYVKLSDRVLKDISDYIGSRTEGSIFISTSTQNLFQGVTTKTIRVIIKNILKRHGLDKNTLSCHSLRRSFAVASYETGADIYSIKDVLRHKNIQTTTRYLQQINRDNNKTEYNVSNLLLGGNL